MAYLALAASLAGCGPFALSPEQTQINAERARQESIDNALGNRGPVNSAAEPRDTIWDLFGSSAEPERQIGVNRYLWAASLDILSFLPLEGADPFSGVISTDWGRVGGDPTPYRVTVYISEPALDARALRVAAFRLQGGRAAAVGDADNRRLEDAILTRARQMRIASQRR